MIDFVSTHHWPNSLDTLVTCLFIGLAVLLPTIGYVFMVLDFRRYLRSLKRGIVHISTYVDLPAWARAETPRAIAALGLRIPCSEEDLKRAYRKRVKQLHPDHGGDQRHFLLLQAHFEEALAIVGRDSDSRSAAPRWPAGQNAN